MKIVNRKAFHNYHILETFEAGIVLSGREVKSVRAGRVDLSESFARINKGEVYLKNGYIYPYQGQSQNYDPKADRKLLLHKKQIGYLKAKTSTSALTLVPLSLYIKKNLIKIGIGLAGAKKKYDHKRAVKERDEKRKIAQELVEY